MFTLKIKRGALFILSSFCYCFRGFKARNKLNMSSISKMKDTYVYISFPESPVYLKRESLLSKTETESRNLGGLSKHCLKNSSIYLAFPRTQSEPDFLDNYIQSAIQSQRLFRQSAVWSHMNFAHCLKFSRKSLDHDGSNESEIKEELCKRGVCINLESNCEVTDSEESLVNFLKNGDFDVGKITCSDKHFLWRDILPSEEGEEFSVISVGQGDISDQLKCVSPIFTVSEVCPVFHSFQEARQVLEKCLHLPEVVELLDISDKHAFHQKETQLQDHDCQHPFVVVEGMDATGKTTLTQILETKLGAARYYTPPAPIKHLRPFFDKLPEIVRRAYYHMGNYIVAADIIKECETRPVIMDRFWHSTTAYGIANETSSGDQPKRGHPVYKWPSDLLKPTLVLFLTVSEDVRKQRHSGRGDGLTFEENSLDKDQLFRQRLCDSYRRMEDPACLEIDAGGTVDEVSSLAQKVLEQHGIQLNQDKQ